MFKPANRNTLHDNVLSQLIAGIRRGEWKPGDKLPGEVALASQFMVSRNCIREVLKALALSNIVEARPGNGTFIMKDALEKIDGPQLGTLVMGTTSLWELKDIRTLLEGHVAYLAALHATDEQINLLQQTLTALPNENITEGHASFHRMLVHIANNSLLARLLASVQREMDQLRARYNKLPTGVLATYTEEHEAIYKMVKEHHPEEAREAMVKHIEAAWTDTLYEGLMENDF